MQVPVFRTWTAGEIITAAELNSNIRDSGNFWLSVPAAELRQTVSQSLTTGVVAAILFDTNDFDNDNGHSTATNPSRYTPRTAGRFQVSGGVSFALNAAGSRHAEIWRNGASVNGGGTSAAPALGQTHRQPTRTMTVTMNGTSDYVEIQAFQSSGGALGTAVTAVEQPTMSVRWVGTT